MFMLEVLLSDGACLQHVQDSRFSSEQESCGRLMDQESKFEPRALGAPNSSRIGTEPVFGGGVLNVYHLLKNLVTNSLSVRLGVT